MGRTVKKATAAAHRTRKMEKDNLRQGNVIVAPGIGSIIMDERLDQSPLAVPLTSSVKVKAGKTEEKKQFVPVRPSSPLLNRDAKSKAERMAEYREENAMIQARNMHVRDVFLENMRRERDNLERQKANDRSEKREMWNQRLRNSPFTVDLLAENERIDEEFQVRTKEESRRSKSLAKKKAKVKNEIILKALAETDDLEALRQEKRALAEEEKRLRAMRDLEKVGKKAIDAAKIIKGQRDGRMREMEAKRELRRQRLQMQAIEEEERHARMTGAPLRR